VGTLYASTPLGPAASEGSCSGRSRCAEPGSEAVGALSLAGFAAEAAAVAIVGLESLSPRGQGRCSRSFFLADSGRHLQPLNEVLRQLYGLTPAEAASRPSSPAATRSTTPRIGLGISRHTGPSQLKQVFAKTGVRRQSELVFLLARGPRASSPGRTLHRRTEETPWKRPALEHHPFGVVAIPGDH